MANTDHCWVGPVGSQEAADRAYHSEDPMDGAWHLEGPVGWLFWHCFCLLHCLWDCLVCHRLGLRVLAFCVRVQRKRRSRVDGSALVEE